MMKMRVRAVFDGEVLRLEQPANLQPNTTYIVTVEDDTNVPECGAQEIYPLTEIAQMAVDMGVTDLSTRHDWYAHGRIDAADRDS
jgi:hypothetical protein